MSVRKMSTQAGADNGMDALQLGQEEEAETQSLVVRATLQELASIGQTVPLPNDLALPSCLATSVSPLSKLPTTRHQP